MVKLTIIFLVVHVVLTMSRNNFGPFTLNLTDVGTCKGPKREECSALSITLKDDVKLFFDILVTNDVIPLRGKIITTLQGKEFLNSQVNKPCDHMFIKPLIGLFLNVTKDCEVLKGHYKFIVDIEAAAQMVYGGKFLYGNWTYKTLLYGSGCNFACFCMNATLLPKNTSYTKW